MRFAAAALLIVVSVFAPAPPASAHGFLDQVNDPESGLSVSCGVTGTGPTGNLYQSFLPTGPEPTLVAVDLRLRPGGSFPAQGYTTRIRIRAGSPTGATIGESTAFVSGQPTTGAHFLVHFDLGAALQLQEASSYVIEWISPVEGPAVLSWIGRADDPYLRGNAYNCSGEPNASLDQNFKTYATLQSLPSPRNCSPAGSPTTSVYLPNVTKTLGGPSGWQTPFIVQNIGSAATDLDVQFYRASDGVNGRRLLVCALAVGASFSYVPNADPELPDGSQLSVVVRSYGSTVAAVVNQHAGSGDRSEAGVYVGVSSGATNVFLPNIVKRFFGFNTPFIIQNLGATTTTATASFVPFDGSTPPPPITRAIQPGRSQAIDPAAEPGLADGKQYAVTVSASEPISVVVNTHKDAASEASPVMYSMNGLTAGAPTVRGPYAVKNVPGVGRGVSTLVVQNLGTLPMTPELVFTPLGGGAPAAFSGPTIAPRAAWAFDPRFTDGDTTKPLCGAAATIGCLADGEYSFAASAQTGALAAVVNVISATTAAGYTALAAPATRYYLPNITRTLGGSTGWTTPLLLQSVDATSVTLTWSPFGGGNSVTQVVAVAPGSATRIDPRDVPELRDDRQYAVTAVAQGSTRIAAIVMELNFGGGDGAMAYEGFPRD